MAIESDVTVENEPGFLFDELVVPDGETAISGLPSDAHVFEFIRDQFRHCKPILGLGTCLEMLRSAGLGPALSADSVAPGFIVQTDAAAGAQAFIAALGKPRDFSRKTYPQMSSPREKLDQPRCRSSLNA